MRYYSGQIIVSGSRFQRDRKDRPFLVIAYNEFRDELTIVPITGSFSTPLPYFHILVHDSMKKSPATGLRKPCVAKCDQTETIRTARVVKRIGRVSNELTDIILKTYYQYWK